MDQAQPQQQQQPETYQNQLVSWHTGLQPPQATTLDLSSTSYGEWRNKKMGDVCGHMLEWRIHCLWLGDNGEPHILEHLSHVGLPALIRLDISGNNIASLQMLNGLTLPALRQLYLQHNHITTIRRVHACSLPSLTFVGLGANPLQQASSLALMDLSGLAWLGLEHEAWHHHSWDMRWVVKLNTSAISTLQMDNSRRIREDRLDKVLMRRFSNLSQVSRR